MNYIENSFLSNRVKKIIYENEGVKELYDYYYNLVSNIPDNKGDKRLNQICIDSMFAITLEYGQTPEKFENIKNNFSRIDEIDLINEPGERAAGFYQGKDHNYTTAKVTLNTARVTEANDDFRVIIHEMIHAASIKSSVNQYGWISSTTGLNYNQGLTYLNEIFTEEFATNVASKYFDIDNCRELNMGKDNDFVSLRTNAWGYPDIENYSEFFREMLRLHNFIPEDMYFRTDENQQDLDELGKYTNLSIILGNINNACTDQPDINVSVYYDKLNAQMTELLLEEIDFGRLQNIPTYLQTTKTLSEKLSEIKRIDKELLISNEDSIIDNNLKLLDSYLFFEKIAPSYGFNFNREDLNALYAFVGSFEFDDIRRRDDLNFPKPKAEKEYQIYSFLEEIRDLRNYESYDINQINNLLRNIPDIKGFSDVRYDYSEFADKSALLVFKESECLRDDMIKASMELEGNNICNNDLTHNYVATALYKTGYLDMLLDDILEQASESLETSTAIKDAYYDYLKQNIDMDRYDNQLLFYNQGIHQKNALENIYSYGVIARNCYDIIEDFKQHFEIPFSPKDSTVDTFTSELMKDLLTSTKQFNGIERTPFERAIDIGDNMLASSYKGYAGALGIHLSYRVSDINDYLDDRHRILKDSDYSFSENVFLYKRNLSKLESFIIEEDRTKVFSDKIEGLMDKGFLEIMRLNLEINESISNSLIERINNSNRYYLDDIGYRKNIETTESIIDCFCELSNDLQKQYAKALLDSQVYTLGEIEQKFIDKDLDISNISYKIDTKFLYERDIDNIKKSENSLDICVYNLETIMLSDRKESLDKEDIKEYTKLLLDADSKAFINYVINEDNLDLSIKESIRKYCKDNPDSFVTKFEDFILEKDNNDTKIQIDF